MIAESSGTGPKIRDHVNVDQQTGVFEVAAINSLMRTADVKSTDGTGHLTKNLPWTSLTITEKK